MQNTRINSEQRISKTIILIDKDVQITHSISKINRIGRVQVTLDVPIAADKPGWRNIEYLRKDWKNHSNIEIPNTQVKSFVHISQNKYSINSPCVQRVELRFFVKNVFK